MAAEFRIGKLFHLTPLVDDLGAAEFFYDSVFSPLCMMRNYSDHWHRDAAIYVIANAAIEPMECYGPRDGEPGTSWYRYFERFGPRVHNTAFYVDDPAALERRLTEVGVRTTDGGSEGSTVFAHPKDTPGMLEFSDPSGHWFAGDPRFSPHWDEFARDYWGNRHPLGVQRLSHITVAVHDHAAARAFFVDVLDSVALDPQPATVDHATSSFVLVGEDTVIELTQPDSPASPIAPVLDTVGESVVGVTFTVRDLEQAAEHLALAEAPVASTTNRDIRLDAAKTWNTEYRFTEHVLAGDPRV